MAETQVSVVAPPRSFDNMQDFSSGIQQNLEALFESAHRHNVRTTAPSSSDGAPGDLLPVFDGTNFRLYVKFTEGWKYCNLLS